MRNATNLIPYKVILMMPTSTQLNLFVPTLRRQPNSKPSCSLSSYSAKALSPNLPTCRIPFGIPTTHPAARYLQGELKKILRFLLGPNRDHIPRILFHGLHGRRPNLLFSASKISVESETYSSHWCCTNFLKADMSSWLSFLYTHSYLCWRRGIQSLWISRSIPHE